MCRDLCRLCAEKVSDESAVRLFQQKHKYLLIQLKEITGIMFRKSADLPRCICPSCLNALKEAHRFRENVINAQVTLKTKTAQTAKKSEIVQGIEATEFVRVCYAGGANSNDNIQEEVEVPSYRMITPVDSVERTKFPKAEVHTKTHHLEDITDTEPDEINIIESHLEHKRNSSDCSSDISDGEEFSEYELKSKSHSCVVRVKKEKSSNTLQEKITEKKDKRKHALDYQNIFICDQCGNHFTCRHHFKLHLRRHTGDKQCACELCPDRFFTTSELRRHMRKHTGERPFACKFCNRRFTDYSTRVKHERTHTNERPFMCSQCGKSFTTSYILKNHMLTHTGERHFRCDVCNKAFTRRTHLVVHFRSIMHNQAVNKSNSLDEMNTNTMVA